MTEEQGWVELSEGEDFAGYRIERRLGRGGMGVLYLAIEPGLERRVALKLIAPEAAADGVFARRFAEESKIAASIEHPNVVPIYAAGAERGVPFIAMRYVSGSDLGRRLAREGRLPLADAVNLIAQIGNGLDAIHAAGLVHRDVKPANVLLSGEAGFEHAYITDFGVARNVATESGLTQTGRFVGTLDYVAPEQISGEVVDARADVYALGCLLFKLLTGEVPFPREGEAARLYAHLNEPPPAPSLYVPEVPMALDDVVVRAMSKQPGDRYPSAGDLGRAAEAALRGERPTVPEHTVATGTAATRTAEAARRAETISMKPSGRSRWALAGVAAAVVAVIAVVVIAFGGGDGGSSQDESPDGNARTGATAQARDSRPKPATLTQAELIEKMDEICAASQETYGSVRSKALEESPDVEYSATLSGISTRAVDRLRQLVPPPGLAEKYRRYLESQERVKTYDRQALQAAEAGDAEAYLAARERRDDEQPQRHRLARDLGLETCSASPD